MISSRFFLTKDFLHKTARGDILKLPAGLELAISHGDHKIAICTLPQHDGSVYDFQFEIPLDLIEDRRYETRLIETRPLRSAGLFMMVQTEEG